MSSLSWLEPDWPAPANVRAASTLRAGGTSCGPFASLNLATHVGDDAATVRANRELLRKALSLSAEPTWLNQVHGNVVVDAQSRTPASTADAAVAAGANQVCVIMTADCLPVLFCDRDGTRVGAAHAGWRGLAGGVLGETVKAVGVEPGKLLAWLGPAIEQSAFEVGNDVRDRFIARAADNATAFVANANGRWQADLYELARRELARLGVRSVYGGGYRCYGDADRFFSYRRDSKTGRMATLVWLDC